MIASLKTQWRNFHSRKWLSLGLDVLLIIVVFLVIHSWNTRNLPRGGLIPELPSTTLELKNGPAEPPQTGVGVIYFFAPWCSYCRHSIGNLDQLVKAGDIAWARTIALDYSDLDELRDFVQQTGLVLPVLLGTRQTGRDWNIQAFPTYFVIDSKGRISSRSVGYSTRLGLWARIRMAQ